MTTPKHHRQKGHTEIHNIRSGGQSATHPHPPAPLLPCGTVTRCTGEKAGTAGALVWQRFGSHSHLVSYEQQMQKNIQSEKVIQFEIERHDTNRKCLRKCCWSRLVETGCTYVNCWSQAQQWPEALGRRGFLLIKMTFCL